MVETHYFVAGREHDLNAMPVSAIATDTAAMEEERRT